MDSEKVKVVLLDKFQRVQGAVLKIAKKKYPVYKGVNTLGRNKDAIINIKNIAISQQHAIITVVDGGEHFISDLNSSNHTFLNNTKLTPFKLYELTDDTEVKFGNIAAHYYKVPQTNTTLNLENEDIESTQSQTQTFYGANTQLILEETRSVTSLNGNTRNDNSSAEETEFEDIHDAKTQVIDLMKFRSKLIKHTEEDIHEAPTQIIDLAEFQIPSTSRKPEVTDSNGYSERIIINYDNYEEIPEIPEVDKTLDIHEMETQVVELKDMYMSDSNKSSLQTVSISDQESTTQSVLRHGLSLTKEGEETVHPSMLPSTSKRTNVERNLSEEETSNDSVDFLAINKPADEIIIDNQQESTDLSDNDKVINKSKVSNSKKESEQNLNDDSDTDIEVENLSNVDEKLSINRRKTVNSLDLQEDKTPIEDNADANMRSSQINVDVINSKLEESSDVDEEVVRRKRKPVKLIESQDDETDIEENSVENNTTGTKLNGHHVQSKFGDLSDTDKERVPTKIKSINPLNTQEDKMADRNKENNHSRLTDLSDTDDEIIVFSKRKSLNPLESQDDITDIEDNADESKIKKKQCTVSLIEESYIIEDTDSEADLEEDKVKRLRDQQQPSIVIQGTEPDDLNDTDCIPATQDVQEVASFKNLKQAIEQNKSDNASNVNATESSEESFKLGLTELMVETTSQNGSTDKILSEKISSSQSPSKMVIISQTKLPEECNLPKPGTSKSTEEEQHIQLEIENDKIMDELLSSETYDANNHDDELNTTEPSEKDKNTTTEDIYNLATQKVLPEETDEENDHGNVYLQPTQKIGNTLAEESIEEIDQCSVYLQPTQKLSDALPDESVEEIDQSNLYLQPTQKLGNTLAEETAEEINQSNVYLQPTQKFSDTLADETVEDIDQNKVYLQPTQRLACDTDQTEDKALGEDLYMMATQKINLTESKQDKNIESDSTNKKFRFKKKSCNLEESVRTILSTEPKEDIYSLSTQKIRNIIGIPSTAESDIFNQPTQPLSIDVQDSNNEPIDGNATVPFSIEVAFPNEEIKLASPNRRPVNPVSHFLDKHNSHTAHKEVQLNSQLNKNNTKAPKHVQLPCKTKTHHKVETMSQIEAFIDETQPKGMDSKKVVSNYKEDDNQKNVDSKIAKRPGRKRMETVASKDNDKVKIPSKHNRKLSEDDNVQIEGKNKPGRISRSRQTPEKNEISKAVGSPKSRTTLLSEENGHVEEVENKSKRLTKRQTPERHASSDTGTTSKPTRKGKSILSEEEDLVKVMPMIEGKKSTRTRRTSVSLTEEKECRRKSTRRRTSVSSDKSKQELTDHKKSEVTADKPQLTKISSRTRSKSKSPESKVRSKAEETKEHKKKEPMKLSAIKEEEKRVCDRPARKNILETYQVKASTSSSGTDHNDSLEHTKNEANQTLALLEAKSSKTRKSGRVPEIQEVKISVPKNRRSMTVSMLENSVFASDIMPISTTRSRSNYNNNLVSKVEKDKTKVASFAVGKRKRTQKITNEDTETDDSEPTVSIKVPKQKATKKVENRESQSIPSTSASSSTRLTRKRNTSESGDSNISNSNESSCSSPKKQKLQMNKTLSTPERSKRKQRPKVVFTMLDNPQLESLIRQLGGSIVDSVDACTVLVTEQVKRSQKLLAAVGQGKPICSPKWIRDSKKANEFLDPLDYILVDKEAEAKWKFSLKESITRSNQSKLLGDYTFQLMVTNAADVLKGAIESCGGKCVARNPGKVDNFLVISSPENKSKYKKILKQNPNVKVVEPEAIFDGVLRQELRFHKHYLS